MVWLLKTLLFAIKDVILGLVSTMVHFLDTSFSLDLTPFNNAFGGFFINAMQYVLVPFAISIAGIIMAYSIFKYSLSKSETATLDNPLELIIKTMIAIFMAGNFHHVFGLVLELVSAMIETLNAMLGNLNFTGDLVLMPETIDLESLTQAGIDMDVQSLCIVALEIFFITTIAKGFLKLMMMWGDRYVYYGIIYYTMPLAFSTLGSKITQNIGMSSIKAFFSSIISLGLTGVYTRLYIIAMQNLSTIDDAKTYLVSTLIVLGLFKFILELDDYLHKIGLINQGMSLADIGKPSNIIRNIAGMAATIAGTAGKLFSKTDAKTAVNNDINSHIDTLMSGGLSNIGTNASINSETSTQIADNVSNSFKGNSISNVQSTLATAFRNIAGSHASVTYNSDGTVNLRNGLMKGDEYGSLGNKPLDLTNANTQYVGTAVAETPDGKSVFMSLNDDGSISTQDKEYANTDSFMKDTGITEVTPYYEQTARMETIHDLAQNDSFKITNMNMDGQQSFEGIRNNNGTLESFKGKIVEAGEKNSNSIHIGNNKYVNIENTPNVSKKTLNAMNRYEVKDNKVVKKYKHTHL